MKPQSADTLAEIEEILLAGYRRMTPREKLRRVGELNAMVEAMAAAGIRERHGDGIPARELRLRLAALRLDRATMIAAFGWDPEVEGY